MNSLIDSLSYLSVTHPSFQCDELGEPVSPRPAGLRRTASFYSSLDGHQLGHGHTLSAVSNLNDGIEAQPGEYADDGRDIDEMSPSDDERFAEAVIRGI